MLYYFQINNPSLNSQLIHEETTMSDLLRGRYMTFEIYCCHLKRFSEANFVNLVGLFRKDLCEGKHDARLRNFVSNFGVFCRRGVKQTPFYLN